MSSSVARNRSRTRSLGGRLVAALLLACGGAGATSWVPFRGVLQPAATPTTIIVAACDSRGISVVACAAGNGRRLWRTCLPDVDDAVNRIGLLDGRVYVGGRVVGRGSSRLDALRLGDGSPAGHWEARGPGLADFCCADGRVFLACDGPRWRLDLLALRGDTLHQAWQRTFAATYLWTLSARSEEAVLVRSAPFGPGATNRPRVCEAVTLRAKDGKTAGRWQVAAPTDDEPVPPELPVPVRKRLRAILARPGGVHLDRTRLAALRGTWYVGVRPDQTAPSVVYAIGASDGRVLWKRLVPGLEALLLQDGRLTVAACGYRGSRARMAWARLLSLAPGTGKPLWRTELPVGTTAASR